MKPGDQHVAGEGGGLRLPRPGDSIDGYQVIRKLGQGGMGAVFLVRRQGRSYALKVITAGDLESLARFDREAIAGATAGQHPNIVGVHSFSKAGDWPYLIMGYVEGAGLDELVGDEPLGAERVLEIGEKIGAALSFIHGKGILHRDLKPANILVRTEDSELFLTDFGLARAKDAQTLTQSHELLGTPQYMAPEQAAGEHEKVGPGADVWALGAVLYRLSTGQTPFVGSSVVEVIMKILTTRPRAPRELNPELPAELEAIILKAMAADIEDRYPSAAALSDDCARARRGEPVEALQRPRLGAAGRLLRRLGPLGLGLVIFCLAALIGVAGVFTRGREQRRDAEALRRRITRASKRLRQKLLPELLPRLVSARIMGREAPAADLKSARRWLETVTRLRGMLGRYRASTSGDEALPLRSEEREIEAWSVLIEGQKPGGRRTKFRFARLLLELQNGHPPKLEAWASFLKDGGRVGLIPRLARLARSRNAELLGEPQAGLDDARLLEADELLGDDARLLVRRHLVLLAAREQTSLVAGDAAFAELRRVLAKARDPEKSWESLNRAMQSELDTHRGRPLAERLAIQHRLEMRAREIPAIRSAPWPGLEVASALAMKASKESRMLDGYERVLAIREHLPDFRIPPGFGGASMAIGLAGRLGGGESDDALERRRAFRLLIRATKLGLYIPLSRRGTLSIFFRAGFFKDVSPELAAQPAFRFWRGQIPESALNQEPKSLSAEERVSSLRKLQQMSKEDLSSVILSPDVPDFMKAIARVTRAVNLKMQGLKDVAGAQYLASEFRKAILEGHPVPNTVLGELASVLPPGSEAQLAAIHSLIAALDGRFRRTQEGRLGEGRPQDAPLLPLAASGRRRLKGRALERLAGFYSVREAYKEALGAAEEAFALDPTSSKVAKKLLSTAMILKRYSLCEERWLSMSPQLREATREMRVTWLAAMKGEGRGR